MKRSYVLGIVLAVFVGVVMVGCIGDPIYRLQTGSFHLPLAVPLSHVLKVHGVSSVFPQLYQLQLHRPSSESVAEVILFASLEIPDSDRLQSLRPAPLNQLSTQGLSASSAGDIAGLGRFACYATWAENATDTVCQVADIAVLQPGWLLYAVSQPQLEWLDITLFFRRTGVAEPPQVSIETVRST